MILNTHIKAIRDVLDMKMFKFFKNVQKLTPGNRIV